MNCEDDVNKEEDSGDDLDSDRDHGDLLMIY